MCEWKSRESGSTRFEQDALLIRDGQCNTHGRQESYFCVSAAGGMGESGLASGWSDPLLCRPCVHASVLTFPHAFYTRSRCRRAVYFRYCASHNRHSLPTLLRLIST